MPAKSAWMLFAASLLLPPSAAAAEAKKRAAAAIPVGTGVVFILDDDREVQGVYLGHREGAHWVGLDGGEIAIEPSTVRKIVRKDTPDVLFIKRRNALAADDVAGWWNLAVWARANSLTASAEEAARKVIELSPEHAEARRLLRHEKIDGRWVDFESAQKAKGLVLRDGEWVAGSEKDMSDMMNSVSHVKKSEPILPNRPRAVGPRAAPGSDEPLVIPMRSETQYYNRSSGGRRR